MKNKKTYNIAYDKNIIYVWYRDLYNICIRSQCIVQGLKCMDNGP